jgi:hypothetical protein
MNESDWLTYLATLAPEHARLAEYLVERCTAVIVAEQRRHLDEEAMLRQQLAEVTVELAELRAHLGLPRQQAVGSRRG